MLPLLVIVLASILCKNTGCAHFLYHSSPICVVDDVGKTAAEMNYYAPLAELDQEKLKNCEVSLIDAGLDGGFDHTSKCI